MSDDKGGEAKTGNDLDLILFPFVAILIGILTDSMNKRIAFLKLPDSVLLFLFSILSSLLLHFFLPVEIAKRLRDQYFWYNLSPNTILKVLLPPLLFESAFRINAPMFLSHIQKIVALTVIAYVFSAFLTGALFYLPLLYTLGWPVTITLLYACILVATDPVAVVAILESMGAPLRLRILIEGESLLNDGLAIFAFQFLLRMHNSMTGAEGAEDKAPGYIVLDLVLCLVGSPLAGIILGHTTAWIAVRFDDMKKKQAFIIISVFVSYVLCDMVGSAALGIVCFGVTMSHNRERLHPSTCQFVEVIWSCLAYMANNIIFVFAGFIVASEMFVDSGGDTYAMPSLEDLLTFCTGFFSAPITMFARAISIVFFYGMLVDISKSHRRPSASDYALLSFGGLRGALGLILALEFKHTVGDGALTGRELLITTSSSTFFSLVVQGVLFGSFAETEEQSKRSLYLAEQNVRLHSYMRRKIEETLNMLETTNDYLVGTKWSVVRAQMLQLITGDAMAEITEDEEQQRLLEQDDDQNDTDHEQEEAMDVRGGFFHHLLAKVHEAFEEGAISGPTAHIMIEILERGIDEGGLQLQDFQERLDDVDIGFFMRKVTEVCSSVCGWINEWNLIPAISQLGDSPALEAVANMSITRPKSIEMWFIFSSVVYMIQTTFVMVIWIQMGEAPEGSLYRLTALLINTFLAIGYLAEEGIFIHSFHLRLKDPASRYRCIVEYTIIGISSFLLLSQLVLSGTMLYQGNCVEKEQAEWCKHTMISLMCVMMVLSCYRLLRSLPMALFLLNEFLQLKAAACERVRLSMLHYLHHLAAGARFSSDLFPERAYNAIRKEQSRFKKIVDALLRMELKKNASFCSIIPIIKTRQAMRVLSSKLNTILHDLKKEGYIHEETVWTDVANKLHRNSTRIINIPALSIRDWLLTIPWIRQLNFATREEVVSMLEREMEKQEWERVEAHAILETHGEDILFIMEGVVKVCEWIEIVEGQRSREHNSYIGQGEFVGERNFLLIDRNDRNRILPMKWPRIRYETITRCAMIRVHEEVIKEVIKRYPFVPQFLARNLQMKRFRTEIKHLTKNLDEMEQKTFAEHFEIFGKEFSGKEYIIIPEGKLAIIGMWTEIIGINPFDSLYKGLYHIIGPATVEVQSCSPHTNGMVVLHKNIMRTATSIRTQNVVNDITKSAISIVSITKTADT